MYLLEILYPHHLEGLGTPFMGISGFHPEATLWGKHRSDLHLHLERSLTPVQMTQKRAPQESTEMKWLDPGMESMEGGKRRPSKRPSWQGLCVDGRHPHPTLGEQTWMSMCP